MARQNPSSRGDRSAGPNKPSGAASTSKRRADAEPDDLAPGLPPGLYVVATPIGNLGDIGARACDVLARADVIACEDTRVTGKLLSMLGLSTSMAAYHDHNAAQMRPKLLGRLAAGARVALVSDAGTPAVSDPGYKLVRACIDAGIAVTAVPGPSAALAALVISGLPTDRFLFQGFLPAKAGERRRTLAALAEVPATLIVFEAAPRLAGTLADMAEVLGERPAAVTRELTKLFEEARRDTLDALAAHYAEVGPPKGEIVIVVGPPSDAPAANADDIEAQLTEALGRLSLRDAVTEVAAVTGRPRRAVYQLALALTQASDADETGDG